MDVKVASNPLGLRRKASQNITFCVKKERNASYKKVSTILQKPESERTEEEKEVLVSCSDVVLEVNQRVENRKKVKARAEEVEDSQDVLATKCKELAAAIKQAKHFVVYSGAGVSTAACIPDYRGTNGIWTRLQQGKDIGQHDLSKSQPTLTHMALYVLYKKGLLKHVVSQNCDGLHLRSGLPKSALSEVHGNMYLEVCLTCNLDYWRLFDVTEHTARYSHETARRCYKCHKPLRDTIVHFGERGALKWPLNWAGACAAANQADVILCIGSSLKVLKKYPWLWCMDKPVKKRPKLYIVNLQWTPKDDQATLKINGKCDEVMTAIMLQLSIQVPQYERLLDPIFAHATILHPVEIHTSSHSELLPSDEEESTSGELKIKTEIVDSDLPNPKKIKVEVINTDDEVEDVKPNLNKDETNKGNNEGKSSDSTSCFKPIWRPFSNDTAADAVGCSTKCNDIVRDTSFKVSNKNPTLVLNKVQIPGNSCKIFSDGRNSHENNSKESLLRKGIDSEKQGKIELVGPNCDTKLNVQSQPLDLSKTKPEKSNIKVENYFCPYCRLHYYSGFCLFYRKQKSDIPPDPPCYCCDDEDEDKEIGSENSEKNVAKIPITNPGWFGKGYRKKIKKKR